MTPNKIVSDQFTFFISSYLKKTFSFFFHDKYNGNRQYEESGVRDSFTNQVYLEINFILMYAWFIV